MQRKDVAGATWTLTAESATATAFAVAADKPVTLDLGDPVTAGVTVRRQEDGEYDLTAEGLKGRSGERVTLSCGRAGADPPHAVFRSTDGSYERRFTFEYG